MGRKRTESQTPKIVKMQVKQKQTAYFHHWLGPELLLIGWKYYQTKKNYHRDEQISSA